MTGKKYRVRLPKRTRLDWNPKWEPEISGMTYKYLKKNLWRCESIHSIEDLMQDAYLLFLKLCDFYPRVIEPPHFMSLYQRSLANMITDKARTKKYKSEIIDETVDVSEKIKTTGSIPAQITFSEGPLYTLIEQGPPELKMFFSILNNEEKLKELRKTRTEKFEPRKNLNQRISDVLGIERFPFKKVILELLSKQVV